MDISHPENPEPATTFIGIDFTNSYSPAGSKDAAGAVHCTQDASRFNIAISTVT